jgi:hypothetical protein
MVALGMSVVGCAVGELQAFDASLRIVDDGHAEWRRRITRHGAHRRRRKPARAHRVERGRCTRLGLVAGGHRFCRYADRRRARIRRRGTVNHSLSRAGRDQDSADKKRRVSSQSHSWPRDHTTKPPLFVRTHIRRLPPLFRSCSRAEGSSGEGPPTSAPTMSCPRLITGERRLAATGAAYRYSRARSRQVREGELATSRAPRTRVPAFTRSKPSRLAGRRPPSPGVRYRACALGIPSCSDSARPRVRRRKTGRGSTRRSPCSWATPSGAA